MDPALEALVREHLEGDEIILGWDDFFGEILVRLISEEVYRVRAPMAKQFGFGGGRSLTFKVQDGRWVFLGAGRWR